MFVSLSLQYKVTSVPQISSQLVRLYEDCNPKSLGLTLWISNGNMGIFSNNYNMVPNGFVTPLPASQIFKISSLLTPLAFLKLVTLQVEHL